MGAFFSSYSIPGDVHEVVDQKAKAWLSRKGFQEIEESAVLDYCKEGERALFLFWNDRWTIVLYSHFDEEERFLFELSADGRPVLHLWAHDSDLWGYELHVNRRPITAFNSNPKYFGSEEQSGIPNDIELLIEKCSLQGVDVSGILQLQKKRGLFKEEACGAFAKAIGAAPAASHYDYESEDTLASPGFSAVHRRFRKHGFDPMRNFNLHAVRGEPKQPEAPSPSLLPSLPLGYRVLIEIMKIAAIPIGWVFGLILAWKMKRSGFPGAADVMDNLQGERDFALEGEWLVNRKRRCRIRPAEGAAPSRGSGILPFIIGGNEVFSKTMSAKEAEHTLAFPHLRHAEKETDFRIGSLPAKFICSKIPARQEKYFYVFFIQSPLAVYHFSLESKAMLESADIDVYQKTIDSFEILE